MNSNIGPEDPTRESEEGSEIPPGVTAEEDFLRYAKGALREEDFSSPAFRRFLIADVDRLKNALRESDEEVRRLRDVDKQHAVLLVQYEAVSKEQRLTTLLFGLASLGAGSAASYIGESPLGWIVLIVFVAMMVVTGYGKLKK